MITCLYCNKVFIDLEPNCDCEARINCINVGKCGHYNCGWCLEHGCPRFQCGCVYIQKDI